MSEKAEEGKTDLYELDKGLYFCVPCVSCKHRMAKPFEAPCPKCIHYG